MSEPIFHIGQIIPRDGGLLSDIHINARHPLFDGHFPGAPVTPGVVELMMVKKVLQQHLRKKLRMKTLRTCKFLEILNPVIHPDIRIDLHYRETETLEVVATGTAGGSTFFKLQATYL